jgi:type III pantothenate kinase
MIVAIDIGNTRIKWALHNGTDWVARQALPTESVDQLAAAAAEWPAAAQVVACNVAGALVEAALVDAVRARFEPRWLRSSRAACGVRSCYDQPEKLGADRWAALIGARARFSGDCLVVCAGTATTVDHLDADGVFRGGMILPGVDLMRASLAGATAQLPLADGEFCKEPRTTVDAIVTGCLQAQLGAIERMFERLADVPGATCLMTGGAASQLAPHLNIPTVLTENLILEGLVRFGTSQ